VRQPEVRTVTQTARRPIVLDCVSWYTGDPLDIEPPFHDGDLDGGGLKLPCINRHNGAVNGLFLDWSAGRIGLKELWTLDWSEVFDPQNARTLAGGVRPEDWPKWMRGFRDY
jgi:prepilin-type processing-associated H-X9-DG protein